jgi:hypothetical protein
MFWSLLVLYILQRVHVLFLMKVKKNLSNKRPVFKHRYMYRVCIYKDGPLNGSNIVHYFVKCCHALHDLFPAQYFALLV